MVHCVDIHNSYSAWVSDQHSPTQPFHNSTVYARAW